MKKYFTPAINIVRINASPLLALSGGGKGSEGDHAESKRFWGGSIFDDIEEDDVEADF